MPLKVYLVGAGPGDPDLITVKGRRILQQADAVLYDHLANSALLSLAPPHAERLYVGKKKSAHAFSQEEICGLLIERARRGLTVVRLKGGDPFLFGRGGEEAEALADAGIPFEIVPGVTTPLGIAAYTGVPLTLPPHVAVRGHRHVRVDRVFADGAHRGRVRGLVRPGRHAEVARFGVDGPEPAVRAGTHPADVVAHRPDLPAVEALRRDEHGEVRLAAGARKRRGHVRRLAVRILDADDHHVLGHPALAPAEIRADAKSETLLSEKGVPSEHLLCESGCLRR